MFLIFLGTGLLAGLLAGLFGIGGSIIMIPILTVALPYAGIPTPLMVHMAIGTSLAAIIITTLISVFSHQRKHNIEWLLFKKAALPIALGAALSAWISPFLQDQWLSYIFSALLILAALRIGFQSPPLEKIKNPPPFWLFRIIIFFLALIGGLAGLGGGVLFLPYLNYCGIPMLKSIGTTAAFTLLAASVSTLCYSTTMRPLPLHWTLGYIYLPALLGILLTSIISAPLATHWAYYLPIKKIKLAFAILLILVALSMTLRYAFKLC